VNPALRHSAAHVFVESLHHPVPDPDDVHHLFRVLRLRDAEVVTVSDGAGGWRETVVDGGALRVVGEPHCEAMPRSFTVLTAIPKGDRAEWMVQKLTEIGVDEITFLHCERSVVRWEGERADRQLTRMRRVAREAAMQSRRVWLPVLGGPEPFDAVVGRTGAVLADPTGPNGPVPSVLVIGPEGGFSPSELECGLALVSLGESVLRVETAAIVAAARYLT